MANGCEIELGLTLNQPVLGSSPRGLTSKSSSDSRGQQRANGGGSGEDLEDAPSESATGRVNRAEYLNR